MTDQLPKSDSSAYKKAFGRDVGKLTSGTLVAQIIGFLAYPVITRLFDPSVYGIFAIFLSLVSIITMISCLRYEQAIFLPKDDHDGGAIFHVCLFLVTLVSLLCIPLFLIFGDGLCELLGEPDLKFWILLVPLTVFIDGISMALRFWNTRQGRFGTQATTQALQSVSGAGLKIGFGLLGKISAGSLVVGQLVGNASGAMILAYQAIRLDGPALKESLSFSRMKEQIIRYKKFPLIDTWSMFFHNLSWQLPVFLLAGFFSPGVAGLYALGNTVVQTPLSLIGGSIGQVFLQRASSAKRDGTVGLLIEDVVELMLLLSLVPLALLMVYGGDVFALVFGDEWFEAGVYVQILAVWAVIWFITFPIGNATSILEIQECRFKYTIANLATRFAALVIGGYFQSVYLAMTLFAFFGILTYGYLFHAIFFHSNASFRKILYNTRKALASVVGIMAVLAFLLYVFNLHFYIVLAISVAIAIGYYWILYHSNGKIRSYIPI
jgi:lipopolysaccharide exporter